MKVMIDIDEDVYTRLFDNGVEAETPFAVADDLRQILRSLRKGIVVNKNEVEWEVTRRW